MKCEECDKKIPESYMPSNFCEECVKRYMEYIKSETKKADIHPEFH